MSIFAKIALAILLITPVLAVRALSDANVPGMVAAGSVGASQATIQAKDLPLPGPERTVMLVVGIAAVVFTFHRAIFRRQQAA